MGTAWFLFRFDGAPDNADFVTRWSERHGGQVYSGTSMRVGFWTPDMLEVTIDDAADRVHLTLIELEATEKRAREHCRQYLPESSAAVFEVFVRYLDTVLERCRSNTDPRLPALQALKGTLAGQLGVVVRTAGALRTSGGLIEVFPLMDQGTGPPVQSAVTHAARPRSFVFDGERRLGRDELDGLRRVVRILHAVVVGKDHSSGTLKGFWNLNRKPLETALNGESARYPELSRLISPSDYSGATIDCEKILHELRDLWGTARADANPERIRKWIKDFHPIASALPQHEPMQEVFDQARSVLTSKP